VEGVSVHALGGKQQLCRYQRILSTVICLNGYYLHFKSRVSTFKHCKRLTLSCIAGYPDGYHHSPAASSTRNLSPPRCPGVQVRSEAVVSSSDVVVHLTRLSFASSRIFRHQNVGGKQWTKQNTTYASPSCFTTHGKKYTGARIQRPLVKDILMDPPQECQSNFMFGTRAKCTSLPCRHM
jgi:hypothetical protein